MQYRIAAQVVAKEATVGKFYQDTDGDLFLYMGDGAEDWSAPWIQFNSDGAYDRESGYPAEPLTEVDRKEILLTLNEKLQ